MPVISLNDFSVLIGFADYVLIVYQFIWTQCKEQWLREAFLSEGLFGTGEVACSSDIEYNGSYLKDVNKSHHMYCLAQWM